MNSSDNSLKSVPLGIYKKGKRTVGLGQIKFEFLHYRDTDQETEPYIKATERACSVAFPLYSVS